MKSVFERLSATIAERELADTHTPVLLMISGGSDSTALAYLGAQLCEEHTIGQIAALHVNHGIRGFEADADQAFVERLCALLGIPLFTAAIDVPAIVEATGENLEAVARHERYQAAHDALESLCRHAREPFAEGRIFTAHTVDDRVENFYMRSIVGTGPGGFRAMRYLNGNVARPCLDVSRQDLRDYLQMRQEKGLPVATEKGALWCEDATNAHTDQFRSFVRHEIIPKAKERNTALLTTLSRTMNLIADEDDMMDKMSQDLFETHVEWKTDEDNTNTTNMPVAYLLLPAFGESALPIQRRAIVKALQALLDPEARVETTSVDAVLDAFVDGKPKSGYSCNIQGNLAVSANKKGVLIEPMERYRTRRNRR